MKIIGLLQVRMNSTRLPGKAVMDLNGLPALYHCYRRLLNCREVDQVACSIGALNSDKIADLCNQYCMYGDIGAEEDLIARHLKLARTQQADAVVRVTADEPLIDPNIVDTVISHFRMSWPKVEFACNWAPRTWPDGQDVDIISTRLLCELAKNGQCPREDYSTWVTKNKCYHPVTINRDFSKVNLCLDTKEDHAKLTRILKAISNDNWNWRDAAAVIAPEMFE